MKKLTETDLLNLIEEEESVYLDYKVEHHHNNASLVHDFLCLSNSNCNSDRYLIYGISDDKKIIGINKDNTRKQREFTDLFRTSKFNRIPPFIFYSININNSRIDILQIQNSNMKPFFLLEDKKDNKITIRAGVIYSRDNDSNTPKNSTASMIQIEHMWREYFGIDKVPLDRALDYVQNIPGWVQSNDNEFYFRQFPEFKLVKRSEEISDSFQEKWVDKKHKSRLGNVEIHLIYHNTILKSYYAVNVEHRGLFPVPYYHGNNNKKGYINKYQDISYICSILERIDCVETYDSLFIIREKIETELDVYFASLKTTLSIYSLNIDIVDNDL